MERGLAVTCVLTKKVINALRSSRIDSNPHSAADQVSTAEAHNTNTREDFLNGVVITGQFIEQVVWIAGGRADMELTSTDGKGIRSHDDPASLQVGSIKVVLKAVHHRADLRRKLGLRQANRDTAKHCG